jgi:hypothetical protein
MALMPEVIRIGSLILTSILPDQKKKEVHKPGDIYTKGNIIWYQGKQCKWIPEQVCISEFIYRGAAVTGCTMRDHNFRGWCSLQREFRGNWRQCKLACIEGGYGKTVPDADADQIVANLRATHHKQWHRRLSDSNVSHEPVMADRFLVSFQPNALNYGLTDDFVRTLIRREAFRGIEDGHEAELGEAKIIGFRIHSGETPVVGKSVLLPAPTDIEKFELNYTRHKGDPSLFEIKKSIADLQLAEAVADGSYTLPLLAIGASILALIAALVAIGCCLWKQRSKTAYIEVASPDEINME